MISAEKIPNNVNLSGNKRLQRALEHWQPKYIQWWRDMGPQGFQDYHQVYVRTAISVDAEGWAHFEYVKLPEYRWGIFLAEPEHDEVPAGGEVPLLVEDAVVREVALPVDGLHLPARADRARVVEVAVEVGGADEGGDPLGRGRDLLQRPACGTHEPRAKEQVLGRVARDRELREQDEVGAPCARRVEAPAP